MTAIEGHRAAGDRRRKALTMLFTFTRWHSVMTDPVRLSKRLVELISCSRREAELYITGGWVTVDGQVVEEPQFKVSQQKIALHPDAKPTPIAPVTILFNQAQSIAGDTAAAAEAPIRADTRANDDPSGIRVLKQHFFRLMPGTPLEPNATGLTVFTQEWGVARKLVDHAATVEQEYIVEVTGSLTEEELSRLKHGLSFKGHLLAPVKVSWQNETRLRFALKGPHAGQITHMCESVGLRVTAIKRIRLGGVSMAKLQPGFWRYLRPNERF